MSGCGRVYPCLCLGSRYRIRGNSTRCAWRVRWRSASRSRSPAPVCSQCQGMGIPSIASAAVQPVLPVTKPPAQIAPPVLPAARPPPLSSALPLAPWAWLQSIAMAINAMTPHCNLAVLQMGLGSPCKAFPRAPNVAHTMQG